VRRYRALIDARALAATSAPASDAADATEDAATDAARARERALAHAKELELWYWLGEAQRRAGDHTGASQSWRRACELAPENRNLKRALAMELVRAADPDGRKMIDELLQTTPDDTELLLYLQPGPYPEPGSSFVPRNGGAKHRKGG
jgi:cytochrome c-type biogenesis protein CcmH/NrfG